MLTLQYGSDLHIEFRDLSVIPKLFKNINADVLILAGDITSINDPQEQTKFDALLQYYCPKYKYILHVAGNHEFYTASEAVTKTDCMDAVHKKFKAYKKKYQNYLYLNCETAVLQINDNSYMFIGATLWTNVDSTNYSHIEERMNDYEHIFVNKGQKVVKFNVMEMQKLHSKYRLFIKKSIASSQDLGLKCILITHHKPYISNMEIYKKSIMNQAYETDMEKFMNSSVALVIYGHTHKHNDSVINNIRYVSNPRGYVGQHCGFKSDLGVSI